jgi:hypothetical protein
MEIISWIWAIAKSFMFWTFIVLFFLIASWGTIFKVLALSGLLLWGLVAFVNSEIQ